MLRGACPRWLVSFIVLGTATATAGGAGCASVKPWERGRLARPKIVDPSAGGHARS